MKMHWVKALFLLLAGLSQAAHAYLPLVDNQPLAFRSCPLGKAISTQTLLGRVGSVNVECTVNGINVVYTLTVPPGCENGGCGLILDTHGMTMNANQENAGTKLRQYGWTAKQYGAPTPFIVVQPNLTDLFDREKILDTDSIAGGAYYNEVPNLTYFVNHLVSVYRVNTARMHMYGFSRGGNTVNAFYCELGLSNTFASYAMGGQDFRCPPDKPLLMISGDADDRHPTAIADAEARVRALGGVTTTAIVNDPGYATPRYVWTWAGLQRQGRHHHMRHQAGNFRLETIRHSGSTLPMNGHCHPSLDYNSWLVCHANMETGRKIIDFFIQNPRR
ncbi:MAG: hypothetical protein K0Q68_2192 [Moraxellaceae bacterium]|nr:hypothetical protein [Moraxellaceae bacterium]